MEIDPEYGDDLAAGFSDDQEEEVAPSGSEVEGGESLDLLSAILEGCKEKRERRGGGGRKRKASSNGGTSKKRREGDAETADGKEDSGEVAEMKARMKKMEAELSNLRKQVETTGKPAATTITSTKPSLTRQPLGGASQRARERGEAGKRKREAHQPPPNSTVASAIGQLSKTSNQMKTRGASSNGGGAVDHAPALPTDRSVSSDVIRQRREDEAANVATERYSGIRIKNPLVSGAQMSQRMCGRKMVKIPRITKKMSGDDIEGDWVTIGVVVDKLPPRDTKKGEKYAIWKLSDLSGVSAVVSLFLFGKAYQEHWKTPQGHVVAVLNPAIMPDKESGSDSTAATSRHSNVALSVDHPQKVMLMGVAYDFTICKAHTKGGRKCTNFARTTDGGYCDYHIQSAYSKMRSHRMEFQHGYGPSPNSGRLKEKLFKKTGTEVFYYGGQTYAAPPGGGGRSSASGNDRGPSSSDRLFAPGAQSTATSVLSERREGRGGVVTRKGVTTHEGSEIFKQMLQTQSVGARMLTKHIKKEEIVKKETDKGKTPEQSVSQFLRENTHPPPPSAPQLGRGLAPGGLVDLNSPRGGSKKPSLAKLKALSVVRRKGPIEQGDSNGRKPLTNEKLDAIQKRVESNISQPEEANECDGPAEKKSKLDTSEVERILNARSSHDWVVKEAEWDKEQEYFDHLEKKENIEEKMASIKELRVTVVQCKECKYIAESPSELCKKERHKLTRFKVTKKCFKCKQCGEKGYTYTGRRPVDPCRKCGGGSFEPASFYRERRGPKLATEELLLRGVEEKFLH